MTTIRIGFTGHRNYFASVKVLNAIRDLVGGPEHVWVHGGAVGFDSQIQRFAEENKIQTDVITPDYERYSPSVAPLVRNRQIVDSVVEVIAFYDGRKKGGTYATINYARKCGKKVTVFPVE